MREALEMALDALLIYGAQAPAVRQTITAIKEALAQPEQKPLAKVEPCAVCGEGKARLSVIRSCDTCHSEYAGQAEMKVALAQDEQELEYCVDYHCAGDCGQPHNQQEMQTFLLAQPLQRPWVSLTDYENVICLGFNKVLGLQYQEAKLKEKNT